VRPGFVVSHALPRRAALAVLALASSVAAWSFAPGDFWNDVPSGQWAEKDVQRLLTKSPWAKSAAMELGFDDMGGPGMGPPDMGGFGPGPGGAGGPGGMTAVVRWESAAPVRYASKTQLQPDPTGCYVISISGSEMMSSLVASLGAEGLENMKKTTSLQRAGKPAIAPSYVTVPFDQSGVLLIYFPNSPDPIQPEDKQVVFETKAGPLQFKVKFTPKEMLYHGELAL